MGGAGAHATPTSLATLPSAETLGKDLEWERDLPLTTFRGDLYKVLNTLLG